MKKWLLFFPALLPFVASAHEGHGIFDAHSLMHYFVTLEHGLPIAGAVMLTAIILHRKSKRVFVK